MPSSWRVTMYSCSGCGRTDSDSTRGASGWLGHGLQFAARSSRRSRSCASSASPAACSSICLRVGLGHVDVGQHLLDRVALLEAQGELVAVARRRLGVGLLRLLAPAFIWKPWKSRRRLIGRKSASGRPAAVGPASGRTAAVAATWAGAGGNRRRTRPDGGATRRPERQADGAGSEKDRPEQHEQPPLWRLSGRPDGGGESVMTIDLCGSGGSGPRLGVVAVGTFCPQRQGDSYILMPESPMAAQQYNRFDVSFQSS